MGERATIARDILLSAPPGQFDALLSDLHVILEAAGEPLTDEWTEQVRSAYKADKVHESDPPVQSLLVSELYKSLESYKKKYYSSKGVVAMVSVAEVDGEGTVVRMYAERLDKRNCLAGSWTTKWTIQEQSIQGEVHLHALCHEEGSIQVQSSRTILPIMLEVPSDDAELLAEKFVSHVSKWEQNTLDSLVQMYDTMGDNLKVLRRVLPVTRKRLDWNIHAHRIAKTLGDSSTT